MKSLQASSAGLSISDIPVPDCGSGDVLIRLGSCGICGSDIANIFGASCKPSARFGHEVSGRIVNVGDEVRGFSAGDRVFVHHHASCGECRLCRKGNETMCDMFVDSLQPNGLSEMFLLPRWNVERGCLFKIPDSLSFEEASMAEPLACCIRAWKKVPEGVGSVAIIGTGTIGILHALLARKHGADCVFCVDINEHRLKFCKTNEIGIAVNADDYVNVISQFEGGGVDLAIVAAPDMSAITKAMRIVRKGGSILVMGEPEKAETVEVDFERLYSDEISLLTSYAASNGDVKEALEMVCTKSIDVARLVTHRFSLADCKTALDVARQAKDSIKVVIVND